MTRRTAKVVNRYGIHCRPAAVIAKEAQGYSGTIRIKSESGDECRARDIMGLIGLGITCDQVVEIVVEGPDEERVADNMRDLFGTAFDFKR